MCMIVINMGILCDMSIKSLYIHIYIYIYIYIYYTFIIINRIIVKLNIV